MNIRPASVWGRGDADIQRHSRTASRTLRRNRLGLPGLALVLVAIYWLPGKRHEYWADNPIFYLWTPALVLGIAAIILAGVGGAGT